MSARSQGRLELVLGIDVGGTTSAFGFVDRSGEVHAEGVLRTDAERGARAFVEALAAAVDAEREGLAPGAVVRAAGVGAPNANGFRGTVERAPNLGWETVVPLAAMLEETLGLPTVLANDANAAALGERLFGAARGVDDLLLVTLGTGVGSGFVVGGRLLLGHEGFAGELGHVVVEPGGRPCGCGRRGCLEAYASVTALVRFVREALEAGRPSLLATAGTLDGRAVCAAAEAEDALAREAFAVLGERLGLALANAVAITNPRRVVLFGGLTAAGELLLEPTRRAFEASLLEIYRGGVELVLSGLPGARAALLGAAALAWEELERRAGEPPTP